MNFKDLAEQAGIDEYEFGYMDITKAELDKFAELVAAHEREECAKIIDKRLSKWASLAGKDKAYKWLEKLSNAIRARGKP